MAGSTISLTGPISYASGSISASVSTSLLSSFTEVSNATLASGNKMYPSEINYTTINDLYYTVESGSYAGIYYINRNDPAGVNAFNEALISGLGTVYFDQFRGYRHWPDDNQFAPSINVFSAEDHTITIKYGGQIILDVYLNGSSGTYDPFAGFPDFCGNGPNSAGKFDAGAVSTGWDLYINVTNVTQNANSSVEFNVYDYHYAGNYIVYSNADINSGTSWMAEITQPLNYWVVPAILLNIN